MKTGRPKKYKSKKALADAIEGYFRSISRTIELKDLTGATIYNDDGEVIHKLQFVVPPSISALCLHLASTGAPGRTIATARCTRSSGR